MICCGFYHKDRARVEFWARRKCLGYTLRSMNRPSITWQSLGSGWLAIIQQEG